MKYSNFIHYNKDYGLILTYTNIKVNKTNITKTKNKFIYVWGWTINSFYLQELKLKKKVCIID